MAEYKSCERFRASSVDDERCAPSRTTSQKVAATAVGRDDTVDTATIATVTLSQSVEHTEHAQQRPTSRLALLLSALLLLLLLLGATSRVTREESLAYWITCSGHVVKSVQWRISCAHDS